MTKSMHKKLILCASTLMLSSVIANAQFKPTDKWPYIYDDFVTAELISDNGKTVSTALVNICVSDNHIHYVRQSDEMILDMVSWNIQDIKIKDKTYKAVGSQVLEVLLEENGAYVLKGNSVDYNAMNKVDIGYGISSDTYSASNVDLSSVMIPGNVHQKIQNAKEKREYETTLIIDDIIYAYDGKTLCKATKNDFVEMYGKNETSAFLKQNKIKWNQPESVIKVIEFMKTNTPK